MKRYEHMAFSPDLSRLLAAAVVSPDFCTLLLQNPARALARGYCNTEFDLSPTEEALVLSIEAGTLQEFAAGVVNGATVLGQGEQSHSSGTANARSAASIPSITPFLGS
ncbi:MAG: hypothetical protein R3272_11275 [Candidatus Promineifilaceae bacterium]|nr:hypothetical protein [Candidatus Promineifilaceae bacterium]